MNKYLIYISILILSCNQKQPNEISHFKDTSYNKPHDDGEEFSGKVHIGKLSSVEIERLTTICKLWGFLKYYHPAVTGGKYNWDIELFKLLPKAVYAQTDHDFTKTLNEWVDSIGKIEPCKTCAVRNPEDSIKLAPDFKWVKTGRLLNKSLITKLQFIFKNRNKNGSHYLSVGKNGNPVIENETGYSKYPYPDTGIRILSLFRYWNIIQYLYPYKYLIGEDWNKILPEFIPKFINAPDSACYVFTCLELIARIHDSHANILGDNNSINNYYGKYFAPVKTAMIEGQLVVTGYYLDTLRIKEELRIGDVIKTINGQSVEDILSHNAVYLPASNYDRQMYDAPLAILMRGHKEEMSLRIIRNNITVQENIKCIYRNVLFNRDPEKPAPEDGIKLIADSIAYINCNNFDNNYLSENQGMFNLAKGLIVDLRGYPSEPMAYTLTPYIKPVSTTFAKVSLLEAGTPGLFSFNSSLYTGWQSGTLFKGPVVVLVNSETGSAAEFTTMALQSSSNVKVLGSTTAGADGDVSKFILPGGIETQISGIGIYYPDGSETQRKGVHIDYVVYPTIKGIKEGKDELLENAKQIIKLLM